jgi:hypothetical protein
LKEESSLTNPQKSHVKHGIFWKIQIRSKVVDDFKLDLLVAKKMGMQMRYEKSPLLRVKFS